MFGTMAILIVLTVILSFISPFKNNRNTAPLSRENERGETCVPFSRELLQERPYSWSTHNCWLRGSTAQELCKSAQQELTPGSFPCRVSNPQLFPFRYSCGMLLPDHLLTPVTPVPCFQTPYVGQSLPWAIAQFYQTFELARDGSKQHRGQTFHTSPL